MPLSDTEKSFISFYTGQTCQFLYRPINEKGNPINWNRRNCKCIDFTKNSFSFLFSAYHFCFFFSASIIFLFFSFQRQSFSFSFLFSVNPASSDNFKMNSSANTSCIALYVIRIYRWSLAMNTMRFAMKEIETLANWVSYEIQSRSSKSRSKRSVRRLCPETIRFENCWICSKTKVFKACVGTKWFGRVSNGTTFEQYQFRTDVELGRMPSSQRGWTSKFRQKMLRSPQKPLESACKI